MAKSLRHKIARSPVLKIAIDQLKDLGAVDKTLIEQKQKAYETLLKWSYKESNLSLGHAFSCWADLDFAHTQLIQQLHEKGETYRQTFKEIHKREEDLKKVKDEKDRTAGVVTRQHSRVEALKKSKKQDQMRIDGAQAELADAVKRAEEASEMLLTKTIELEEFKAETVRNALICYSSDYLEILSNIQMIFQTKKEIGEMMIETPVYDRTRLSNGNDMVKDVFKEIDLELPMRDDAHDRYQLNRTFVAPPSPVTGRKQMSSRPPQRDPPTLTAPKLDTTVSKADNSSFDEDDDDIDHVYCNPDMGLSIYDSTSNMSAPQSPNDDENIGYITPITPPDVMYGTGDIHSKIGKFGEARLPPGFADKGPIDHPSPPQDLEDSTVEKTGIDFKQAQQSISEELYQRVKKDKHPEEPSRPIPKPRDSNRGSKESSKPTAERANNKKSDGGVYVFHQLSGLDSTQDEPRYPSSTAET